ncbi:hypothetical protein [Streptomyces luteoverticillatus]|uniref:hypothetical protein n=1 Tax=Streptomyces luteoverticillatus TaxID=66425 RepID=UPI0026993907
MARGSPPPGLYSSTGRRRPGRAGAPAYEWVGVAAQSTPLVGRPGWIAAAVSGNFPAAMADICEAKGRPWTAWAG